MADAKISQLTEKQTLGDSDLFVIATSGNNYSVKGETIKDYAQDGLATVATSGSYSDLSNTPTIPTVNDATLTITQNGTSAGTFTANASSDVTIAITETVQSATSPLSISSNALSISQADTSTNGYLSSTDWNTFNGKQNVQTVVSLPVLNVSLNVAANTRYVCNSIDSLTISTYQDSVQESEIDFTTGFTGCTLSYPVTLEWVGTVPTLDASKHYVIVIKNSVAVIGEAS